MRRLLDIPAERIGSDDPWLVVDGLLYDSPGLPADMVFLGHYSRPALWARMPGNRVRMEFKVMPDDDPDEIVTPAAIERISHGLLPRRTSRPTGSPIYSSARVSRRSGGQAASSWPATPPTRLRPCSARACAPACAMSPTSPGSSAW